MLLQYGPHFFSTLSEKFGQLARFFGQMIYRPPGKKFPVRLCEKCQSFGLVFPTFAQINR